MAICYLDRTFCQSDCVNRNCYNNMWPDLEKRAADFGLPIALSNLKEGCANYVAPNKEG
jgi:hypothetical protein